MPSFWWLTALFVLHRPVQTKEEKKALLAAKKAARKEKKAGGADEKGSASATPNGSTADLASLSLESPEAAKDKHAAFRTVTGVLTSRPTSRDIKIDGFTLTLNGHNLVQDCSIELTIGRRCVAARRSCPRGFCLCEQRRPPRTAPRGRRPNAPERGCCAQLPPSHAALVLSVASSYIFHARPRSHTVCRRLCFPGCSSGTASWVSTAQARPTFCSAWQAARYDTVSPLSFGRFARRGWRLLS